MSGKGSSPRPVDLQKYSQNYERIFKKDPIIKKDNNSFNNKDISMARVPNIYKKKYGYELSFKVHNRVFNFGSYNKFEDAVLMRLEAIECGYVARKKGNPWKKITKKDIQEIHNKLYEISHDFQIRAKKINKISKRRFKNGI